MRGGNEWGARGNPGGGRAGRGGSIGGRVRHSDQFHEIEHFMEGRGPSKTRVVGQLYKLFVQYQFVGDSNGWLRTSSSHKVISGIFSL